MRHTLAVEKVVPWSQYNEYEGHIEGRLDGHPVVCKVFVPNGDWTRYRPGDTLEVDAQLVRYGDVEVLDAEAPPELRHRRDVGYAAVGTVRSRDGERLVLDSVLPLEVDLALAPFLRRKIPDVAVGDRIRVEGSLEVDLDPDED